MKALSVCNSPYVVWSAIDVVSDDARVKMYSRIEQPSSAGFPMSFCLGSPEN